MLSTVSAILEDVRYGCRMFRKEPRFAALIIVTLALGIGACTTVMLLGLAAAGLLARVVGSLLFEVAPTDPIALAAAAAVLLGATSLACVMPARRAASADPVTVMKCG